MTIRYAGVWAYFHSFPSSGTNLLLPGRRLRCRRTGEPLRAGSGAFAVTHLPPLPQRLFCRTAAPSLPCHPPQPATGSFQRLFETSWQFPDFSNTSLNLNPTSRTDRFSICLLLLKPLSRIPSDSNRPGITHSPMAGHSYCNNHCPFLLKLRRVAAVQESCNLQGETELFAVWLYSRPVRRSAISQCDIRKYLFVTDLSL